MMDRCIIMVYGLGERWWIDENGMMTSDRSEAKVYTSMREAIDMVAELRRHGESATTMPV